MEVSVSEVTPLSGPSLTHKGVGENKASPQQQPARSIKTATGSDEQSKENELPRSMEVAREIGQANFQEIITEINRELDLHRIAREFRVDEASGKTVVRLYDKDTGDLIREVPPEQLAQLSRQARELIGILMELRA
jgi:flagellar protein FlaG